MYFKCFELAVRPSSLHLAPAFVILGALFRVLKTTRTSKLGHWSYKSLRRTIRKKDLIVFRQSIFRAPGEHSQKQNNVACLEPLTSLHLCDLLMRPVPHYGWNYRQLHRRAQTLETPKLAARRLLAALRQAQYSQPEACRLAGRQLPTCTARFAQ